MFGRAMVARLKELGHEVAIRTRRTEEALSAGWLITVTQLGYALGVLLIVPLGDMLYRRRLARVSSNVVLLGPPNVRVQGVRRTAGGPVRRLHGWRRGTGAPDASECHDTCWALCFIEAFAARRRSRRPMTGAVR